MQLLLLLLQLILECLGVPVILRCIEKRAWRGQEARHDVGWVRLAQNKIQGMLGKAELFSSRVLEQVNAMFILRRQNRQFYRLAHVSLLQVIGNPTPKGPEGMGYVQRRENGAGDIVVWLRSLESMVHLIPLELGHR